MQEKGTEIYFMMAILKYDIQIYWQEAVLISSLSFLYMPPLASFLVVYLIQSFHPIYKAFPNLSYIVLALIFSLSTMYFHCLVFLLILLLLLCHWLFISIYTIRIFSIFSFYTLLIALLILLPLYCFSYVEIQIRTEEYYLFKQQFS